MREDCNNINMPCWTCPYGHNCKYYSDPVWDQWIVNNNYCPAMYYEYSSIYKAIQEDYNRKHSYVSPLTNVKS